MTPAGVFTAGTVQGTAMVVAKAGGKTSSPVAVAVSNIDYIDLDVAGATIDYPVTLAAYTTTSSTSPVTWKVKTGMGTYSTVTAGKLVPDSRDVGKKVTLIPTIEGTDYETFKKEIPIYNSLTITTDNGNPTDDISFYLPGAVYTKMTGGKDSSNITQVTGYQVSLYDKDNKNLYNAPVISATPGSVTLKASELEKIIEFAGDDGKLPGSDDKGDFKLKVKIFPAGKSQTKSSTTVANTDAGDEAKERTVYYLKIRGDNFSEMKKDGERGYDYETFSSSRTIYGQKGYEAKVTLKAKSGYSFARWEDDNTSNPRTYKFGDSYESKNLKATTNAGSSSSLNSSSSKASGSGAGSGNAGAGLDKVPKTGEGNTRMLIIMIAMISATIAGAILLSYMPARANANKGIAGAEDVKGFFDSTPTTSVKDTNTEQTSANTADKEDEQS